MVDAKSPEPTAPWWATLIAIVLTAVVSVMGTVYALGSGPSVPGAPAGVASLVADTITYIPHIMLLFGVLADMFTYEGVYSIPSLVGILSIVGNWILRFFWRGLGAILEKTKVIATETAAPAEKTLKTTGAFSSTPLTPAQRAKAFRGGAEAGTGTTGKSFFQDYDGCNVQGFSSLASAYAPQTLVVTATIFMYYLFDIVSNRGWLNALGGILFFAVVYVGQAFVIKSCKPPEGQTQFTMMQQALMALAEGTLMGGLSYSVVAAYYPTRLPTSVISPFPRRSKADLTPSADGGWVDADGNPYLILGNGQAVPDMATEEARKKFAGIVGETLGSGTKAVSSDCKA